jgi:CubicO group peptidase (beta-lactamase class C family)
MSLVSRVVSNMLDRVDELTAERDRLVASAVTGASRPRSFPMQDWDRAPWNRWCFLHVAEILPTTVVRCGDAPSELLHADMSAAEWEFADPEQGGLPCTVQRWLDSSETDGFIVLSKGRVVLEQYANGMTATDLHLAQSMSKSITATACGALVGKGLVDPHALVTDYLPELKGTAYKGAKVQHVLDMAAAVTFEESYTDVFSGMGQLDVSSGWKEPPTGEEGRDWPASVWQQILSLKEAPADGRAHGALFDYRTIETDVLAHVMQRACGGKPLAQIVSDELWRPMGASADANFTVDSNGYALADAGFSASLRDFARLGRLWASRGKATAAAVGARVDGEERAVVQVIPEAWVAATLAGDASTFQAPYSAGLPGGAYRNKMWLRHGDGRGAVLMCRGVFGQLIYVDVERDFVAVKLSSWPTFTDGGRFQTSLAAIDRMVEVLHQHDDDRAV